MKACIVVPHYDHLDQFRRYLPEIAARELPLIVVDDASRSDVVAALQEALDSVDVRTEMVRHSENKGKGGAVTTGLRVALELGYSHALQVDADGQHDSERIADFLAAAHECPDTLICGQPVFDNSQSKLRYFARYITLGFVWLETLSTVIRDPMCGFRLYPLQQVVAILDSARIGGRMAFDPELLVRWVWKGLKLRFIPIDVKYPEDGRSHFHYMRDNLGISWMHTRLLAGMVLRLPQLLGRKLAWGAGR